MKYLASILGLTQEMRNDARRIRTLKILIKPEIETDDGKALARLKRK